MPTFASFPSMKSVTWIFSVVLVALMLGGCGQEDGKSIDQEANEALEENKRLKEKIARMEASKEIDERERQHIVETPEKNPDPVQALTAEQIEEFVSEAEALYDEGKYREAKAKMVQAYADFERLPTKDKATRVRYLRYLSNISNALQENDQTIAYATEVAIHAVNDDDRAFAYGSLGQAYYKKGEYDKAIGYYEKDLAIGLKTLGADHPDVAPPTSTSVWHTPTKASTTRLWSTTRRRWRSI
jgi:tetratricopeptide (TPR) repeat protein